MKILRKALFILILSSLAFLFADEVYNVQKGDTLYSISRKFQITVAELRTANNLSENDVLKAGQRLVIPTADIGTAAALSGTSSSNAAKTSNVKTTEYVVQKGDTLYRISKNNNMTVAELLALNNLDNNAVIKVGQKLKVRAAVQTSTASAAKTAEIKADVKPDTKQNTKSESSAKADSKSDSTIVATDKTPDTRTYGTTTNADSSTSWPVKNPKITAIKGKASGVQLSCKENEPVTSVRAGTVMYVGLYRGYGQVLFIQSKTGLIYAYTGLSDVKVKKGDYVVFGDEVGTAGKDAINGSSQITFMVFQNGTALDPAKAPRG